jgi:hypothetical protein
VAKTQKKQSATKEQSKESLAKAKYHAAKAAKRAARVAASGVLVNEGATGQPVPAVATKPKRARYVREINPVQPCAALSVLPPRRTTFFARIMSKGIAMPPKEERVMGLKLMG